MTLPVTAGTSGYVLQTDGAGVTSWVAQSGGAGTIVRGALAGLILSNDGTTPHSVLDIAAGQCADSAAAAYITLGAFTKSTAGTWAAGTGNNGMGAGLTIAASTWYHVFAIINAGTADVYFDTSVTAANAPASTTAYRRIGSFLTDSSAYILAFVQVDDTFYWSANPQPLDVSTTTLGATAVLYTMSAPLGIKTRPILRATTTSSNAIIISSPDQPDVSPSATTANCQGDVTANWNIIQRFPDLYTNTSSQIRARSTASSTSLYVRTLGYADTRGRYA